MLHDPVRLVFISITSSIILGILLLFYRFIFPQKKINLLVLLILISILPIISIFRTGTYEAGDLTLHSVFLQSFYENLREGILIPQWAGGLCGGYGCPVFLFEYTMPFYIGSFFHFLGFSYLNSMKLFLAFAYILSGITMYICVKEDYGEKAGLIAALLYLFAPIRFIEMHFRVSVGTDASFIFIPLAFYLSKKALSGNVTWIILSAINFLLLILSHSSTAFITVPAAFIYAFIYAKDKKNIIYTGISYVLGVGLSAYYVLPALFEVKYSWMSQILNAAPDFKPLWEYIYSPVRFGLLFQGNQGENRLIIGYAQLFIVIFTIYLLVNKKIQKNQQQMVLYFLIYFFSCFILMQSITKPLWENIFFLKTFVLPWRLLTPIAFTTAFVGAIITKKWHNITIVVFCLFIIFSTILNWGNRKMIPEDKNAYTTHWSLYTEYMEPNNSLYLKRYKERINDVAKLVLHRPVNHIEFLQGKGIVKEISRGQIYHEYVANTEEDSAMVENTYFFPGWKIYINDKPVHINIKDPKRFGALKFPLKKGTYHIEAKFEDTLVRKVAKNISEIFAIIIVIILFKITFIKRNMSHL